MPTWNKQKDRHGKNKRNKSNQTKAGNGSESLFGTIYQKKSEEILHGRSFVRLFQAFSL